MDEKDRSAPPGDQALEEEGRLVVAAGRFVSILLSTTSGV